MRSNERAPLIADLIYRKTVKGNDELRSRMHGLSPRARQLLLLVDGERSTVQLLRIYSEEDLAAYLAVLEIGRFIETSVPVAADTQDAPASPRVSAISRAATMGEFGALRARLLLALLQAVGPAAEAFALRITHARRLSELRQLLPAAQSIVEVVRGADQARRFVREVTAT